MQWSDSAFLHHELETPAAAESMPLPSSSLAVHCLTLCPAPMVRIILQAAKNWSYLGQAKTGSRKPLQSILR